MYYTFYKQDEGDKVWWVEAVAEKPEGPYEPMIGDMEFSFDQKKVYNLFQDYPQSLSPEEKRVFDQENEYWVDFFKDHS